MSACFADHTANPGLGRGRIGGGGVWVLMVVVEGAAAGVVVVKGAPICACKEKIDRAYNPVTAK